MSEWIFSLINVSLVLLPKSKTFGKSTDVITLKVALMNIDFDTSFNLQKQPISTRFFSHFFVNT